MSRKPPFHYWFCRVYAAVVWLGFTATMLPGMYLAGRYGDSRLLAWSFAWFPFYGVATILLLSPFAFPWPYCVFGRFRRTPLPSEPAIAVFYASYGRFGRLNCTVPMITWIVYRSGLGIKIALFGNVYLPARDIVSILPGRWLSCTMEHDNQEVRGPILLPMNVARAVESIVLPSRSIPYAEALEPT
ncbi:MAG TPA: hypothetical protein VJ783_17690 [Pirellulales bacterium]|nr:hypothetical protein [Pirellulales bacterium]